MPVALRASVVAAVFFCVVVPSRPARAADPGAARVVYDRGAAAFGRKSYAEAAREFASADELSPSDAALSSALTAVVLADDPVLGMTLVERAEVPERGAGGGGASAAATKAREKFGLRAGKLHVECSKGNPCEVRVDGVPFPTGAARWVGAGLHVVQIAQAGAAADQNVTVVGGSTLQLIAPSPPPPPLAAPVGPSASSSPVAAPPLPVSSSPSAGADGAPGLSPAWFFVGAGLTAVAGAFTVASGVDTLDKHGQWDQTGDASVNSSGRSAQTRTNVLVAVTGGLGLATLGLGLFGVRWGKSKVTKASASLGVDGDGPVLVGRY